MDRKALLALADAWTRTAETIESEVGDPSSIAGIMRGERASTLRLMAKRLRDTLGLANG
jgi:antitoxin component HigA of HigAB toxin-antitoxin module